VTTNVFDPSWYRVADLKPRIRNHARFHRHAYRGRIWHVLQDRSSERFHRFAPEAYFVIGRLDGRRTVRDVWHEAIEVFGDAAPTQAEVIQILSHLHTADVLQCESSPDTAELWNRHRRRRNQARWQRIKTPLAIRIPLLDPERFLGRLEWAVRPLFSVPGALLWCATVGGAIILAGAHWPELSENVTERVLAPHNLILLWLSFVVVKALHELGHGFAAKVWGGEVHEMGIMVLVFMPIPYVDASAASAFRERRKRVVVGAAGMIVEVFVAALAFFVWLSVEPGLARTTAYNVMIIAGVSTVLFNANPLLRFDGYYILADLLDMPNLAARSNRYLGYLIQRHAFGAADAEPPTHVRGERRWFVAFGVASFVYRLFIYAVIIMFVAGQFFFIGVLLALWAAFTMLVQPTFKGLKFVFTSNRIRKQRGRAVTVTAAAVLVVAAVVGLLPLPYSTLAEGVIWVPEKSIVRLDTEGFVQRVVATPGRRVERGELLVTLVDPRLRTEIVVVEQQIAEARSRRRALQTSDLVQAEITDEEIGRLQGRLDRLRERAAALQVRAPVDGTFVLPRHEDLPGRFFRQGEQIAYVVQPGEATARVVVPQTEVDLVRAHPDRIEARLVNRLDAVVAATILREVPAATDELPSLALGSSGGGSVAVDPRRSDAAHALHSLFQFDLLLDAPVPDYLGSRLFVRFDHGYQTLGVRWYRGVRQLLLGRFNV